MLNLELAHAFARIADLLEIDGQDSFRVSSYRRAARTLEDTSEDLAKLADENRLTDLPGIGKGTADRIKQYLATGSIDVLKELEAKFPPGLPGLLEIPGMGPKKVALLHKELGIKDVDGLKSAIEAGKLEGLPGLGATTIKKIADGITFLAGSGGRTPMGLALPIAEEMVERVRKLPGVKRAEIAGSLRRGKETIGDIDILCDAKDGSAVVKAFTQFDDVTRVLAAGATKGSVTVMTAEERELQVDVRVVPSESFGAAWQYFTGSKEHNVRLRERAQKRKWKLNEYGLFDGDTQIAGRTEEEIYQKLGVPCVPPELRENRGECEPGYQAPELITLDDIRGDLHMHTVASDGHNSIEDMAQAAKALGYEYIAICDHSKSAVIANGLSVERLREHAKAIRAANKKVSGIAILAGCECDILPDGKLDYPDDVLAELDWVVASIHTAQSAGGKKRTATERTLMAVENPYVCAIGHPTGRLINKRPAMELEVEKVAKAAAQTGTFLEINASWQRLDLKDGHVQQALAAGALLTINTDAHRTETLRQMRLGVITARRGGATKKDVANCMTLAALKKRVAAKRG